MVSKKRYRRGKNKIAIPEIKNQMIFGTELLEIINWCRYNMTTRDAKEYLKEFSLKYNINYKPSYHTHSFLNIFGFLAFIDLKGGILTWGHFSSVVEYIKNSANPKVRTKSLSSRGRITYSSLLNQVEDFIYDGIELKVDFLKLPKVYKEDIKKFLYETLENIIFIEQNFYIIEEQNKNPSKNDFKIQFFQSYGHLKLSDLQSQIRRVEYCIEYINC